MGKVSGYGSDTTPDSSVEFVATDPLNTSMASTGTTVKVPLSSLGYAVTGWHDLVRDFGADPTGGTSASTALASACTAAVAAQPATYALKIPPGTYTVTAPQDLPYNMIFQGSGVNGGTVSGEHNGTWFYLSSSFSGGYFLGFKDSPAPTSYTGVDGCLASGFGIYGGNQTGSAVNGLYIVGPTLTTLAYVSISQTTGWAVATGIDSGAAEQFPFGQNWFRVASDSCGTVSGGGFQLAGCEDSTFMNCYSIGNNNGPGFLIQACDNTKFIGCNSEWNINSTGYGFYVTGDWQYFSGGCTFTGCSTDANGIFGFYCDATWTTGGGAGTGPGIIHVTGCHFRRDGQANGAVTAGFALGATTLPVIVNGFSTMPSRGDTGGSTIVPAYGMYFSQSSYAQPVCISDGLAWGNTAAYRTGSTANSLPTVTNGYIANVAKAHGPNYSPVYGS